MDLKNLDWRKPSTIIIMLAVVLIGAIIIVSILRDRIVNEQQWQISVTGEGKITYQPDTAKVSLGLQIYKAYKAEEALKQLNDKMTKVVAAIKALGVADSDIITQNYSLNPQYDYPNGVASLTGFNANQNIVITVKNIQNNNDLLGKVISAASQAGANLVNSVSFENSNLNDLKQQARLKAIADARSKAGALANALGVKLKKVVGWWENSSDQGIIAPAYGIGGGGAMDKAMSVIPTGDNEMTIQVNISYQIR